MALPLDLMAERGHLNLVAAKPFSLVYRSADGTAYIKVYRSIDPAVRRDREIGGLRLAAQLGVSAPTVRRSGQTGAGAWVEVSAVAGKPCGIDTSHALAHYLDQVFKTTSLLHRPAGPTPAGSQRSGLLDQLGEHCRKLPWWPVLHKVLADLDRTPLVHLHADLKPEHLFTHGERLSVIDWETSTPGPAVRDYADAAFHLVRDLLYAGTPARHIPAQTIGQLPVTGSVLAWRLALWLDRRRPKDAALLTPDDIEALATTTTAEDAVSTCATTVARLKSDGVPR